MNLEDVLAAKAGDKDAMARLLKDNRKLMSSIVLNSRVRDCDYDDAMQVASVGFMRAVQLFDPDYGVMPSTYIYRSIRNQVKGFRWRNTLVAVPHLGEGAERNKRLGKIRYSRVVHNESKGSPLSGITDYRRTQTPADIAGERQDSKRHWEVIRKVLSPREVYILEQRVIEDRSLSDIGEELGISSERVRQIQELATKRVIERKWWSDEEIEKQRLRDLARVRRLPGCGDD